MTWMYALVYTMDMFTLNIHVGILFGLAISSYLAKGHNSVMKHQITILLIIAVVLTMTFGCKQKKSASTYLGDPYMGSVRVSVVHPDFRDKRDRGTGSAHITELDNGKSKLTIFGAIKKEDGDTGFSMEGVADGASWKSDDTSMVFEISKDGSIQGGGTAIGHEITFAGNVTPTVFKLVVKMKTLTPTQGGYPSGTVFSFDYDLRRKDKSGSDKKDLAKTTDKDEPTRGCENIRWVFRNIWTPGGLQMIQVPECY
jgi:hypothetical protein